MTVIGFAMHGRRRKLMSASKGDPDVVNVSCRSLVGLGGEPYACLPQLRSSSIWNKLIKT